MLHSLTRLKLLLPPVGPLLVPAIFCVSLFGAILPPGKGRSLGITAILVYLVALVVRNPVGNVANDTMLPIDAAMLLLQWVDFYVLHTPEEEYYRIKDGAKKHPEEGIESKGWKERLKWAWDLKMTLRGIGWNWEVKNIPSASSAESKLYILTQLAKAFIFFLAFDVSQTYLCSLAPNSPTSMSFFDETFPRQALFAWLPALDSYYSLNMQFPIFTALTVGLGWCTPESWPNLMGKLRDVSTVRGLWGKFWHQCLRRTLSIPYQALTQFVPIKKETIASRYGQLFLAFIASGLLHHFPVWSASLRTGETKHGQLIYFFLQPLAITLEDLVVHLGKKSGIKESWRTRLLGKMWTLAWFTFSLRYVAADYYESGFLGQPKIPSLCKSLTGFIGGGPVSVLSTGKAEL